MTTDYHFQRNVSYGQWDLSIELISESIALAFPAKIFSSQAANTDVVFQFLDALDPSEVTVLEQIVTDFRNSFSPLPLAKEIKFNEIDSRTADLVAVGFIFPPGSGLTFSLSLPSQIKLMGIEMLRNDPAMVYPIRFNSKDDTGYIDLADETTVHNMTLVAFGTYRQYVDTGSVLKAQVRAATTVDEVNAIVDNR